EGGEELHGAGRGLAPHPHRVGLRRAEEDALVLAQRLLDLLVARQRGLVVDAQAAGGLAPGLVVVADAALGHQPRRLVGEPAAAFALPGFRMLARAAHGDSPVRTWERL